MQCPTQYLVFGVVVVAVFLICAITYYLTIQRFNASLVGIGMSLQIIEKITKDSLSRKAAPLFMTPSMVFEEGGPSPFEKAQQESKLEIIPEDEEGEKESVAEKEKEATEVKEADEE